MTSTIEGPGKTSVSANQLRSTFVYGNFANFDNSSSSIPARAFFQRDIGVGGNLFLGDGKTDASGAFLDSSSNIQFTLNKEIVSIPATRLKYLKNVTSDIQQQIQDLSNNINNDNGEQSTFTDLTVNGFINGLKIKSYANENTSFSSGNTEILGSSNTRFGYFTGSLLGYSNAVFGDQSLQNCTGHSNTAIGHNSQNGNTSYNWNTSLGSNSNIIGGSSNIAIGHVAQCSNCSNSIVIGNSITCTTNNEILLGSSVHTVQIPGNINILGKISQNIGNQNTAIGLLSFASNTSGGYNTVFGYNSMTLNTGGAYCTAVGCNALQSSNAFGNTAIGFNAGINVGTGTYNTFLGHNASTSQVVSGSTAIGNNAVCNASNQIMIGTSAENVVIPGNLTFLQNLNNISTTTFGFLSGVTSSIQNQINTASTVIAAVNSKTTDIIFTAGQINKTTIYNQCETTTLSFANTLNNISTTTFSYLSGVTSSIQNQINALANTNPPGTVIQFAGSSANLQGYLPCNGDIYNSSNYNALFNAIGTIYGDGGSGTFRVPDYRAVFLRGAGQQNVRLNVIAGGGGPIIFKGYTAPDLGKTVIDQSAELITSAFVDNINTQVKSVVTGSSAYMGTFSYTNAISSLNFTTNNNGFNYGNQETHPVHASVNYFIKT